MWPVSSAHKIAYVIQEGGSVSVLLAAANNTISHETKFFMTIEMLCVKIGIKFLSLKRWESDHPTQFGVWDLISTTSRLATVIFTNHDEPCRARVADSSGCCETASCRNVTHMPSVSVSVPGSVTLEDETFTVSLNDPSSEDYQRRAIEFQTQVCVGV